jgi:type II secretory pathway pseudopilin PulG
MTSPRATDPSSGEAGFSLLEVVIAITILMTVLVAVSSMLATSFKVGANSRYEQEATQIASATLDSQLANGATALLAEPGDTDLPNVLSAGQTYVLEMEIAPYDPGTLGCVSPASDPGAMLKVTVWATWANVSQNNNWWVKGTTGSTGLLVEETSLLAVPAASVNSTLGSILVNVQNAADTGVADLSVTATPSSGAAQTAVTTQGGCVLFANISASATWTITFVNLSGYITEQESLLPTTGATADGPLSITADATTTVSFDPSDNPSDGYDKAATVTPTYSVPMADGVHPILPSNISSMPLSFYSAVLTSSPYVSASPAQVFPIASTPSYSVVSGSCGAESAPDGGTVDGTAVSLSPGGNASPAISLVPVQIFVNSAGTFVPAVVTAKASNAAGTGTDTNCPTSGSTVMPTLNLGTATTIWSSFHRGGPHRSKNVLVLNCVACATTTTLSQPSTATYGSPVTLSADVTCSGTGCGTVTAGTVTFVDTTTGLTLGTSGSVSGSGVATFVVSTPGALILGSNVIKATYNGSGKWVASAASASKTETINAAGTTTTVVANPNPSSYGTSVILTATVTANSPSIATPTGAVTFKSSGVNIAGCVSVTMTSGAANCTLSASSGGTYTVTAVYAPSPANFTASTSSAVTQSVTAVSTTTTLTSSANPSTFNTSVTLTATVAPTSGSAIAVGSVAFMDGSTVLATVAVNGFGIATTATSALALGNHSLSAVFTPTSSVNFATSTGTLAQVVKAPAGTPYTLCGLPYGVWLLSATYSTFKSANEPTQVVITINSSGIYVGSNGPYAPGSAVTVYIK